MAFLKLPKKLDALLKIILWLSCYSVRNKKWSPAVAARHLFELLLVVHRLKLRIIAWSAANFMGGAKGAGFESRSFTKHIYNIYIYT